jgi:hypothetical protein
VGVIPDEVLNICIAKYKYVFRYLKYLNYSGLE